MSAKVNFALDGIPEFPRLPGSADPFGGFLNIGPTIEYIERAPYELKVSDWDTGREPFGDEAQAVLEEHFPGSASSCCTARSSPHWTSNGPPASPRATSSPAGPCAPQMYFFRPAPGWSQCAAPIDDYYQCGSGTHLGGCVIGSPGRLASQRILRDRTRNS